MPDSREALFDRHLAGELSQSEQRALAQHALDDPELFDLLTTVAAMKAVVSHGEPSAAPGVAASDGDVVRHRGATAVGPWGRTLPRRLPPKLTVGVGLAAAVVLTFVMLPRRPEPAAPAPAVDRPLTGVPTSAVTRPRLLASRLGEPAEPRSRGAVSPGALEASRPPKQDGAIIALASGVASIDLGSLDGLSTGMALPVVRGTATPAVVGRLTVTATSLERARARVAAPGMLQVGDQVQTPAPVYLSALDLQVAASIASDDLTAARTLSERAVSVADSADIPAERRRATFAQLGAIEYRLQAFAEAERHYRSAQTTLDTASAPERARILNELGAVLIAVGDYAEAAEVLRVAQSAAAGTGAVAGQIANNLAALAVLRGDEAQAASLYTTALGLIDTDQTPSQADRSVVEKNLAALRERR